ncbi:hypothetical protein GCM10010250_31490 [Streptomyces althioticus]|nr:hypothetical protein GCM10010250_31490 [Streptomyces althioticus]
MGTGAGGLAELNRRIRRREVGAADPLGEQATVRRLVADQLDRVERAGKRLPYWLGLMGFVATGLFALGASSGPLAPRLHPRHGRAVRLGSVRRRGFVDRFHWRRQAVRHKWARLRAGQPLPRGPGSGRRGRLGPPATVRFWFAATAWAMR